MSGKKDKTGSKTHVSNLSGTIIRVVLLLFMVSLVRCSANREKTGRCNGMNQRSVNYISSFSMQGDTAYLDTALSLTDSALKDCKQYSTIFFFRKLDILSRKHDYPAAIDLIRSLDKPVFNELSYYNNYLLNRFRAMYYQEKGDLPERNQCLENNLRDLEHFITLHEGTINSLIAYPDPDSILNNPLHMPFVQYYYCRSVLNGPQKTKAELDSLRKAGKLNPRFHEFLMACIYTDLSDFNGY